MEFLKWPVKTRPEHMSPGRFCKAQSRGTHAAQEMLGDIPLTAPRSPASKFQYGWDYSPKIARYTPPASAPPTIGASQKSHNCDSAHPPTKIAGPVLRAGFTERFVTGMPIR